MSRIKTVSCANLEMWNIKIDKSFYRCSRHKETIRQDFKRVLILKPRMGVDE